MKRHHIQHSCLILVVVTLGFSFHTLPKKGSSGIFINLHHKVDDKVLKLDSVVYTNKSGQEFTVTKFKYYLSQMTLRQENGQVFSLDEYFLVNEEDSATKHLRLKDLPAGKYSTLSFIIGVDSLHNCSGAQSGVLDPVNGMFWAWNSGYIFLKLEGFAAASHSPQHIFEYHIGGYKTPANCIRKVELPLEKFRLAPSQTKSLDLKVDLLALLSQPTPINFETLSSVADFHNASLLADNYKNMFSLLKPAHED